MLCSFQAEDTCTSTSLDIFPGSTVIDYLVGFHVFVVPCVPSDHCLERIFLKPLSIALRAFDSDDDSGSPQFSTGTWTG